MSKVYVHVVSREGHRQSYLDLFCAMSGAQELVCGMRGSDAKKLISADRVLISMLDDDVIGFVWLVLARWLKSKPTAALFLRPQSCFGIGLQPLLKRMIFMALKRLPGLKVITITPFELAPHFAQIAHAGVYDPQYWDLSEKDRQENEGSDLATDLVKRASGRPLICALGRFDQSKGMDFLVRSLETFPDLAERYCWIAAGPIAASDRQLADRMEAAGGIVVNHFLSDQEMRSLYKQADAIWACYAPDRDQASGIFGRAIQLNVPVIVRSGSLIERLAQSNGFDVHGIHYDMTGGGLVCLDLKQKSVGNAGNSLPGDRDGLFNDWQSHFVETINDALAESATRSRI